MKKIITIYSLVTGIFLLATYNALHAQNLVLNGDFELGPDSSSSAWCCGIGLEGTDSSYCIPINYTTPGPTYWSVLKGTPDRMVNGDIPCNWDNDTAASGKAYIVIGGFEAGKATLTKPLEKDSAYKLSYWIIINTFRGRSFNPVKIYFKFSNTKDSIISPLIKNTSKWLYHDTIFIANANATEIEISGSGERTYSGSNIDNVSLVKTKINFVNNFNSKWEMKIFPNPSTGKVFFKNLPVNTKNIEISDILGRILMIYNKKEIINNMIDLSSFKEGTYMLYFETTNSKFTKLILINK